MADALAALQSTIGDAHASATALRIVGAGSWLTAGRPVVAAQHVSTTHLTGIIEYVPGDLVLTAYAGTTLEEIAHVTSAHDQWLALDPYTSIDRSCRGTIGATIATASQGPLALGYGRARDLILGLTVISGTGAVIRVGGRVVKNVAGFDLVRLATGAWGTLGVIAQVSLRLHARPLVDETFAVALPAASVRQEDALTQLVEQLNGTAMLPVTSSLAALVLLAHDSPAAVRRSQALPAGAVVLLARATGNRGRVDAQRNALATLGPVATVDPAVWRTVGALDVGTFALRVTDAPLRTPTTCRRVDDWLSQRHASQVQCIIEPMRGAVRVCGTIEPGFDAHCVLPERAIAERLPADAWPAVPSAVDDHISQRLRTAFDPSRILNPGILGDAPHAPLAPTST